MHGHSPLRLPPRVLCRASRRPAQSRRVSFSVDAGARSRRVARGGMGTNGAKRSLTVLRAGRGRRTPETMRCVCAYIHIRAYVHTCRCKTRAPMQSLHSHVAMQSRNIRGSRLPPPSFSLSVSLSLYFSSRSSLSPPILASRNEEASLRG